MCVCLCVYLFVCVCLFMCLRGVRGAGRWNVCFWRIEIGCDRCIVHDFQRNGGQKERKRKRENKRNLFDE